MEIITDLRWLELELKDLFLLCKIFDFSDRVDGNKYLCLKSYKLNYNIRILFLYLFIGTIVIQRNKNEKNEKISYIDRNVEAFFLRKVYLYINK